MSRFVSDPNALSPSRFAAERNASVTQDDINALVQDAASAGARLNVHTSPADDLHAMVILQPHGNYAQPRAHASKSKVFHIIEGELLVLLFSDQGAIDSLQVLTPGKALTMIVHHGVMHTNVALSPYATYLEVIAGPFERSSAERTFADFAPPQTEQDAGLAWLTSMVAAQDASIAQRMQ